MAAPLATRLERKEARRRRLLAATLVILAERGYNETSVDQVVAQARTSKSSFYEFFDSKEDCVRDLLTAEGGSLIHAVTSAAAQGTGHRDRMDELRRSREERNGQVSFRQSAIRE